MGNWRNKNKGREVIKEISESKKRENVMIIIREIGERKKARKE